MGRTRRSAPHLEVKFSLGCMNSAECETSWPDWPGIWRVMTVIAITQATSPQINIAPYFIGLIFLDSARLVGFKGTNEN
ncbi:hypothetical protein NXC24_CH03260 [Rhizobium sp. NXC24]|nr:hypothetical protein NXC24_CH03260 [Rhizobium sp. NXC24]